jgi:hypothetical protein
MGDLRMFYRFDQAIGFQYLPRLGYAGEFLDLMLFL